MIKFFLHFLDPLLVGFQHSNYNVTEGNEYFIPVHRQTRLDNQINLDIQGCNGELPGNDKQEITNVLITFQFVLLSFDLD